MNCNPQKDSLMADNAKTNFKDLSPEAQEAVTPRGEYLHPEDLDKGTGFPGAPKTPKPARTERNGDPADDGSAPAKKRKS